MHAHTGSIWCSIGTPSGGVLVVAAQVDITTAFIKDYNATAKPKPGAK